MDGKNSFTEVQILFKLQTTDCVGFDIPSCIAFSSFVIFVLVFRLGSSTFGTGPYALLRMTQPYIDITEAEKALTRLLYICSNSRSRLQIPAFYSDCQFLIVVKRSE